MASPHAALIEENLHRPFHYEQDADPGAVGAGLYWLDTNSGPPMILYRRNATDDGWDEVGGSGAALTFDDGATPANVAAAAATGDDTSPSRRDHVHLDPVIAHAAAADPHEGYVLESLVDAAGDLIVGTADNTVGRLAKGSDGEFLGVVGGSLDWTTPAGSTPTTTQGDIIKRGAAADERLAIGTEDQVLTVVDIGAGVLEPRWAAAGGGGGSGAALLPLDIPPGSAHASDDEFPGSSLDAKWTNPLTTTSTLTLAVADGWLTFEPSDAGAASTGKRGAYGIRQVSPSGSFTVSAKITSNFRVSDDARVGLFVARTASTQAHVVGMLVNTPRVFDVLGCASYSESADWGAFDGYNVPLAGDHYGIAWFRIVWDSGAGSLAFWFSLNGVAWELVTTRTGQSQPDRMGLCIYGNAATVLADRVLGCDWFRVTEP